MSNYHIKHLRRVLSSVSESQYEKPENFWEEIAEEHFIMAKKMGQGIEHGIFHNPK